MFFNSSDSFKSKFCIRVEYYLTGFIHVFSYSVIILSNILVVNSKGVDHIYQSHILAIWTGGCPYCRGYKFKNSENNGIILPFEAIVRIPNSFSA
jgi:hypothetical protein